MNQKSTKLLEAVLAIEIPFIEIHFSKNFQKGEFQHLTNYSDFAIGEVVGLGFRGYMIAAQFAAEYMAQKSVSI